MNRKSQNGIALVITLIMLSVVTFMAILFLAVTRRERGVVSISADSVNAQLMADAARARAQAHVMARMLASTNMFDYDFLVSTNYNQPRGFFHQKDLTVNPTNVSYSFFNGGRALFGQDLLQNIANLQYDPRPPVFIRPNEFTTNADFRFYLDFNRNGRFETNGPQPVIAADGRFYTTNGVLTSAREGNFLSNNFVGDPEWIGVLEHPDRPHSETNRFIGRYAYLVLPAGKSLDLNFIHNQANSAASDSLLLAGNNGYFRNQGVGSWELNLAGFLRQLNTNAGYAWPDASYRNYNPLGAPNTKPVGAAFDDARGLLAFRYANLRTTLKPMSQIFFTTGINFTRDLVDDYAAGPLDTFNFPRIADNDRLKVPWPGSENTNAFQDVQELFTIGRQPSMVGFTNRLMTPMSAGHLSSYDRYTYYRLLSQMGVDSAPALKNKININYEVERGKTSTNISNWVPSHFFLTTADAMLKASIFTNISRFGSVTNTNYFIGSTLVRPDISITNIQIYLDPGAPVPRGYINPTNEYTASIHRILQVAANLYDATTNAGSAYPYYPTVFRPVFTKTVTNLIISGFIEEQSSRFLTTNNWWNIQTFAVRKPGFYPNVNLYGQALVIGAKKGYPNFNEFTIQTAVQVSRKLEVVKRTADSLSPVATNQMYLLGITNLFGIEAWNSYTQTLSRPVQIFATNQYSLVLSNVYRGTLNRIRASFGSFGTNMPVNSWSGNTNAAALNSSTPGSFKIPLNSSVILLTNLAYEPSFFGANKTWFAPNTISNYFESSYDPPEWQLYMTNSLTYIMLDSGPNSRILDYVSLDGLTNFMNISQLLASGTNSTTELIAGAGVNPGSLWDTNRVGGINGPTAGELTQIRISLGDIPVSKSYWESFNGARPSGYDKDNSIELFRRFVGTNQLNRSLRLNDPPSWAHQAPFTPTRRIYKKYSWQANDPLVHYMAADLTDPLLNDPAKTNNVSYLMPNLPLPASNLGRINERYRPWGSPGKDNLNDPSAFSTALKDPLIFRSDDWDFPQNPLASNIIKFPNIGWIGRIHRGTPWQTVYLKSAPTPATNWYAWSGSFGTDPTNDWKFMDLFTTALNDNAARGLLSVNQTNIAAWSAVLSGVAVASNSLPNFVPGLHVPPRYTDMIIDPGSPQLQQIVDGINAARARQTNGWTTGVFTNMGSILATPELTDKSPFLNIAPVQQQFAINDAAYERIPRQILSLIKEDEPRIVIYSFGQSLKPAPRSLVTDASFYGLCTNYQITGESMTKDVIRFEGELNNRNNPLRTVIESHMVLPPSD